ncbi:YidB family protein [uncultured Photobacterium sp.]|uniref:YidB family protein n=1 Tax=uncultured Photobacterium sp. TaxID=173973 RepID=UPI002620DC4C|nr:YidB family protein [uncultured Photobacterium sp.]
MDIAKILEIGAQLFSQSQANTGGLSQGSIVSALSRLLGGDENGKGVNLKQLLSSIDGAGFANVLQSWLGKGENSAISTDDISKIFSGSQLSDFANELNIPEQDAKAGLSEALPAMVDNASPAGEIAGELLNSVGGISGLFNMAASLFGKK